jgi:hypothetical protein
MGPELWARPFGHSAGYTSSASLRLRLISRGRFRLQIRVLQHLAVSHPLRCVLPPYPVKSRLVAIHSRHRKLLPFRRAGKRFCRSAWDRIRVLQTHSISNLNLQEGPLLMDGPHRSARNTEPELFCFTPRRRKDASRSLNREGANRAWVFEVKYFKYTSSSKAHPVIANRAESSVRNLLFPALSALPIPTIPRTINLYVSPSRT